MKYRVELTHSAQEEAAAAYRWIAEDAPGTAARWFNGLVDQIDSLSRFPLRCPLAPESSAFQHEIRQLLYGNYRLLFTIRGRVIHVLHVRHAARRPIGPGEATGLPRD